MALLMCYIPQPHHHLLLCNWYTSPIFSSVGGALLPTGLCKIWLSITIFSLGFIPPCSILSSSSNIKTAAANHPILQKEADELLAKEATETIIWWCWFLFQCVCCSYA